MPQRMCFLQKSGSQRIKTRLLAEMLSCQVDVRTRNMNQILKRGRTKCLSCNHSLWECCENGGASKFARSFKFSPLKIGNICPSPRLYIPLSVPKFSGPHSLHLINPGLNQVGGYQDWWSHIDYLCC